MGFCPHIPNTSGRVSSRGNENVQCRMETERVNSGEVSVVMADDLVGFQIPTFDHLRRHILEMIGHLPHDTHLVLSAREEIRMPRRDGKSSDSRYMACQRQLQLPRSQIPNLDDTIPCASRKPLVSRFHCHTAYPTEVTRDDAHKFPLWVIRWLDCSCGFVEGKCF